MQSCCVVATGMAPTSSSVSECADLGHVVAPERAEARRTRGALAALSGTLGVLGERLAAEGVPERHRPTARSSSGSGSRL